MSHLVQQVPPQYLTEMTSRSKGGCKEQMKKDESKFIATNFSGACGNGNSQTLLRVQFDYAEGGRKELYSSCFNKATYRLIIISGQAVVAVV